MDTQAPLATVGQTWASIIHRQSLQPINEGQTWAFLNSTKAALANPDYNANIGPF